MEYQFLKVLHRAKGADYIPIFVNPLSKIVLVCFHFAGGSAQSFFTWRDAAQNGFDLFAAELPGRGRRTHEDFVDSIPELARSLADSISILPNKPYVFFGHSLGALIAYETARVLSARGQYALAKLIISARQSPDSISVSKGLPLLDENSLTKYLRNLAGTPEVVLKNEDLMRMVIPILRADLKLIYSHKHVPSKAMDIPIITIGAINDDYVTFESLLGWGNMTTGTFHLHMIKGGHFAIMDNPETVFDLIKVSEIKRDI
jgi:medium-chain acyl-[acyl-carrier-protein] hydrolase